MLCGAQAPALSYYDALPSQVATYDNGYLLSHEIAGDMNSLTALAAIVGGRRLYAANDRLGFDARLNYSHGTWVEVSYSGVVLGKYDLGPDDSELAYGPCAVTASGRVYAAISREHAFHGWAMLDRSTHSWREVTGYPKGHIVGSDGDNVLFAKEVGATTVLQSISSGSLKLAQNEQQLTSARR